MCGVFKSLYDKAEQVLLFCIAIQYWSPGIGIAILLWKMSNTGAIPEFLLSEHSACTAHEGITDIVAKKIEIKRVLNCS